MTLVNHRRGYLAVTVALAAASVPAAASAAWPERPIRFIVPFPAGGGADIMARPMTALLGKNLGQQVVVDNRGGAGGTLAAALAASAAADGYTLFFGTVGTHAIHSSLYSKLPYDPVRDFAPVSLTHNAPRVLVVHVSLPVKSVGELIALAKGKPGQLSFASAGNGGTNHLSGELFKVMAGVNMVHVPFKGAGPAAIDVLAGRVPLTFDSIPVWISHIRAGKVRALGVTSLKRSATLPDVPTVAESGLPGFDVANWLAVYAPAKTPKPVVERLNTELKAVMADTEIRRQLVEQGVEPMHTRPEELAALMRRDAEKWAKIVQASGAKLD
jgi:tripartite-type tricarboxylate transporter receptor subunit TctC